MVSSGGCAAGHPYLLPWDTSAIPAAALERRRRLASRALPAADEVEIELRAQIERARRLGIRIDNLDCHMGVACDPTIVHVLQPCTALCFIEEEITAVREILRVARRRFAIGLLNRHSLLYLEKGRGGGRGGYRGAHWHTVSEARQLFHGLPVRGVRVRTAIPIPSGGWFARLVERVGPSLLPGGAFILVVGDIAHATEQRRGANGAARRR